MLCVGIFVVTVVQMDTPTVQGQVAPMAPFYWEYESIAIQELRLGISLYIKFKNKFTWSS